MREIRPLERLNAVVRLPGSKSYTQRALVISALAQGASRLRNVLTAEDTKYLMEALRLLGVLIEKDGDDVVVSGTGGQITNSGKPLFLGYNGTALRFLTSLVSLGEGCFVLTGEKRLCERPVMPLLAALKTLGVHVATEGGKGFPPVTIDAHGIAGGMVVFTNVSSSQYVSSVLISAPYARDDVRIALRGHTVSQPYIEMTLEAMRLFGVETEREGENDYLVKSGQRYTGRSYLVEGDASSASYFFLAAAICKGRVKVLNINPHSLQGDIRLLEIMENLGCNVTMHDNAVEITGGSLRPGDFTVDMGDMPDMVPTLSVLAAFREGQTEITNVAHLRIKESDRIAALANEITRMGVMVQEKSDGLIIMGGKPQGADIETYNDHRIAMSFAIAGMAVPGVRIHNPECVKKSFPSFWDELDRLYG